MTRTVRKPRTSRKTLRIRKARVNGAIVYAGPSELDGAPIVVIVTGLAKASTNGKTGNLLQTWILRQDQSPLAAIHSGADVSICGTCPHRGTVKNGRNSGRSCYVRVHQAPQTVWLAWQRGLYAPLAPDALRGRRVRLGAYGDPAAVPLSVWQAILDPAELHTGYTHQWRTCDPDFAQIVMASCDSPTEYWLATALGYRAFRVRSADEPLLPREVVCPASKEAGHKTSCDKCVACGGLASFAKVHITIIAHGAPDRVNAYQRLRQAA